VPQRCPDGQILTQQTKATSETEGCSACPAGRWTEGGNSYSTACQDQNCPAGSIAEKVGALTQTDGCLICAQGT